MEMKIFCFSVVYGPACYGYVSILSKGEGSARFKLDLYLREFFPVQAAKMREDSKLMAVTELEPDVMIGEWMKGVFPGLINLEEAMNMSREFNPAV